MTRMYANTNRVTEYRVYRDGQYGGWAHKFDTYSEAIEHVARTSDFENFNRIEKIEKTLVWSK